MQKRDSSNKKLPKIAPVDDTISSKLFSLTGLRIFQAKFMEDLRHPKNSQNNMQTLGPYSENASQLIPSKSLATNQSFTGKDRANELRINEPINGSSSIVKQIKKLDLVQKNIKVEKIKLKSIRPRGLRNLGNTCYMNAILQSIFSVAQFGTALQKQLETKKSEKNVSISYSKLVQSIQKSSQKEILVPSDFKNILGRKSKRFDNNSQQDAQEFLTAFLQNINQQMSRIKQKPKYQELKGDPSKQSIKKIAQQWWKYFKQRDDSIVCDFFQGQTQSMIICNACGFRSLSFDNFWGLPISLGKKSSSLSDLLVASVSTEHQLQDYSCNKCKKQKKCNKTSKLFRLPEILIIQLKRFGFGWSRKQKIKDKVEVPLELNLKSILSQDTEETNWLYSLKSTVQHSGQINFGHYTSHVWCEEEERWYLCNDEHITREEVELDSCKLYLLIYQRK